MGAGFEDRKQTIIEKTINGETYEQIYTQMLKPVTMEEWEKLPEDEKALAKPYPFDPHTYEAAPGIICEQDVAVEMRDGIKLYCDIFRPKTSGADEQVPAILAVQLRQAPQRVPHGQGRRLHARRSRGHHFGDGQVRDGRPHVLVQQRLRRH